MSHVARDDTKSKQQPAQVSSTSSTLPLTSCLVLNVKRLRSHVKTEEDRSSPCCPPVPVSRHITPSLIDRWIYWESSCHYWFLSALIRDLFLCFLRLTESTVYHLGSGLIMCCLSFNKCCYSVCFVTWFEVFFKAGLFPAWPSVVKLSVSLLCFLLCCAALRARTRTDWTSRVRGESQADTQPVMLRYRWTNKPAQISCFHHIHNFKL